MSEDTDFSGDLMLGAKPIARFLNTLFESADITTTDVYNWCSRDTLPHSKLGAKLVGSKSQIRQFFYGPRSPATPTPAFRTRR